MDALTTQNKRLVRLAYPDLESMTALRINTVRVENTGDSCSRAAARPLNLRNWSFPTSSLEVSLLET